jgi:hypothetical protein
MTTLSVFELAQQEAEESVWVPVRATKFISQLLSPKYKKLGTRSATGRHGRQKKPPELRMSTQLQSISRRRYTTSQNNSSSKIVRIKGPLRSPRSDRTNVKLTTNK